MRSSEALRKIELLLGDLARDDRIHVVGALATMADTHDEIDAMGRV